MSSDTESQTVAVEDVGNIRTGEDGELIICGVPKSLRNMDWLTKRLSRVNYRLNRYNEDIIRKQVLVKDLVSEQTILVKELQEAFVAAKAALETAKPREPKPGDVTVSVPTGSLAVKSEA